jgi:hypothetical protein
MGIPIEHSSSFHDWLWTFLDWPGFASRNARKKPSKVQEIICHIEETFYYNSPRVRFVKAGGLMGVEHLPWCSLRRRCVTEDCSR